MLTLLGVFCLAVNVPSFVASVRVCPWPMKSPGWLLRVSDVVCACAGPAYASIAATSGTPTSDRNGVPLRKRIDISHLAF